MTNHDSAPKKGNHFVTTLCRGYTTVTAVIKDKQDFGR